MKGAQNQNPSLILWIVWGAMFFTLFIYMLVLYIMFTHGEGFDAPEPEFLSTLRMGFGAVALGEIAAIFVLRRAMFFSMLDDGNFASAGALRGRYTTVCFLSWILTESVAIYGFVLAFVTQEMMYYFVFFGPAAALYLILRPQLARHEDELAQKHPDKADVNASSEPEETPAPGSW